MSGSGISWAICKSAPRSRQTTTPAPHTLFFTGRMPFLPPNQLCQSTEGTCLPVTSLLFIEVWHAYNKDAETLAAWRCDVRPHRDDIIVGRAWQRWRRQCACDDALCSDVANYHQISGIYKNGLARSGAQWIGGGSKSLPGSVLTLKSV